MAEVDQARRLHRSPGRAGSARPTGGCMGWFRVLLVLLAALPLAGCEAIGDIFQAGMAVGVIMVIAVIALIGFVVAKMRS